MISTPGSRKSFMKPLSVRNLLLLAGIAAICLTCATPSILVTEEQRKGDDAFNKNQYNQAATHYRSMLEASRKLGIYRNLSMEAGVMRKLANCHEMLGDYPAALSCVQSAIDLDSLAGNTLGTIESLRQKGKIFIYMGQYNNGIAALEIAVTRSEGLEESIKDKYRLVVADNYLALGQLYGVMGRLRESLTFSGMALSTFRQAGDSRGEMEATLSMGTVYADLGDLQTARSSVTRSMALASELNLGTARHNQILASLLLTEGRFEDAVRHQNLAIDDASGKAIRSQIIWAEVGLGDIYRELGDLRLARKHYRNARLMIDTTTIIAESIDASVQMRLGDLLSAQSWFISENSITGEGISSLRIAELLVSEGKNDSALLMTGTSEKAFTVSGNRQGILNSKLLRGKIMIELGNYTLARPPIDSVITQAGDFPETSWQAYFQLGRLSEKLGRQQDALKAYLDAISVIEEIRGNLTLNEFRSLFFDSKREVYDHLINLLIKRKEHEQAFLCSENARARSFYDMLSNRRIDFRDSAGDELISAEQEKRDEVQKLFRLLQSNPETDPGDSRSTRSADQTSIRAALDRARDDYSEILVKLRLENPEYAEMIAAKPASLGEFRTRIDDRTAVLSYWISNNMIHIWLVTNDTIDFRSISKNRNDLLALVDNARKSIQNLADEQSASLLRDLHLLLIEPFAKNLENFSKLIIIPNGPLHFLPFQCLIDAGGRYLVNTHTISYAPSASVFVICNDKLIKSGTRLFASALGDLRVDNNVGLPGTVDEVKRIVKAFPDNVMAAGTESTETFVKKNVARANFIHLATHGIFNEHQPVYSYLLFPPSDDDDGKLNVYEVFELDLNAKLVTLSACETGLGNISEGDEITGLSRAFIYAGSGSVVVSLWPVADYPTALLMTSFYNNLKTLPAGEALSMAQREIMKSYPQPLYWSPFILIGNGNITAF